LLGLLLAAAVLSVMMMTPGYSRQGNAPPAQGEIQALSQGLPHFGQLIKANRDAVVNIRVAGAVSKTSQQPGRPNQIPEELRKFFQNSPFGDRFSEQMPQQPLAGQGSGFITSSDGFILTNAHVVDRADEIIVRLSDRSEYSAELIGADQRSDIALLKIDASDLPYVQTGDSEAVGVGDWVVAIGSPFGFEQSASQGIVSALGRSLPDGTYVPFIQTDAAVNPGNSGGPLFDLNGRVIGVNSQIYSRSGGYMGLSFAIPINVAMNVVEQLKGQGFVSRGWLGVMIQDMSQELAQSFGLGKPQGALVAQVLADSPAAAAGFQVGDVIISYDGKPLDRSSDLPPLVGATLVDSTVPATVWRDGEEYTLSVKIARLQDQNDPIELAATDAQDQKLGVSVADLEAAEQERLAIEHGVLIQGVEPASPADKAGLRSGDVILSFNREDITSARQLADLVKQAPTGKPAVILIKRNDGRLFVPVPIS
jgi:serine protease Do